MPGEYLKLKELVSSISEEVKKEVEKIGEKINIACLIIGADPASLSYLNGMKKSAEKNGMGLDILEFGSDIKENEFLAELEKVNNDKKYSGIIVQVPLPKHIAFHSVAIKINWQKDIDGISPYNLGLLFSAKPFLVPATSKAVDAALDFLALKYNFTLAGKRVALIGRSLTVGKPLIPLLLSKNMTPTVIHTKTINAESLSSECDIVVAACGVPEFVNKAFIKKDAVVIDVGIHSIKNESGEYKMYGDVNSASALDNAKVLTAVPGGIGSVTSIIVYANAIKCWYKLNKNIDFKFSYE